MKKINQEKRELCEKSQKKAARFRGGFLIMNYDFQPSLFSHSTFAIQPSDHFIRIILRTATLLPASIL